MTWPVVQLGEVADTALGKMLDKAKRKGHAHVPYLRNVNVQWGRIDTYDLLTMELAEDERERFAVCEGDLLVCEGGDIGRCAIWRGRTEYLAYQKALHRIRPSEKLDALFLRYLLEHHAVSGQLAKLATGTTIAHLPQQQLRRVPVPLPPIEEQRRIVDLLEDHLSRLEAAENYLNSGFVRAKSMVTSSLAFAVAAAAESAPMKTVGELAQLVQYGSGSKCRADRQTGDVPVLRMGNVKNGDIDWERLKYLPSDHSDFPNLLLSPGDLLFNRTNSAELVGKSAVFDSPLVTSFASYLIRVRFSNVIDPRWANMAINSPQGREYVASVVSQQVGQANVNGTKLKAFPLPVPTLERQHDLLATHEQIVEAARDLNQAASVAARRSAGLRQSLLAAAFSGRLTGAASDLSEVEARIAQSGWTVEVPLRSGVPHNGRSRIEPRDCTIGVDGDGHAV